MNSQFNHRSLLGVNTSYDRNSSPSEAGRARGSVDGWSVESNSSHTRSADVRMTRSDSGESWNLVDMPTPSSRSHLSPEGDYVDAALQFSSSSSNQGSYIHAQDDFNQDPHMMSQNSHSSPSESQYVWNESYLNTTQGSPLQDVREMDDSGTFDFQPASFPAIPSYGSSPEGASFSMASQPWAPTHEYRAELQHHIHFSTAGMTPLTVSIPMPISTQYSTIPTFAPHINFQSSPMAYGIMGDAPFPDNLSQEHSSPSSTNSYHHQMTPERDPIEPVITIDQYSQSLTITHDISQSMVAHAGSSVASDVALSPPEMHHDAYPTAEPAVSLKSDPTPTPIKMEPTPWPFAHQEPAFSTASTSPVTHRGPQTKQSGVTKKPVLKRTGGREKNVYKLPPKKAQEVRERREQGACWTCALQRDVCSGGSVCNRCQKRIDRGLLDASDKLCCVREKLYDFIQYFVPQHVTYVYGDAKMTQMAQRYIRQFSHKTIRIQVQPILGLLSFECEFHEFEPIDQELLIQRQYFSNSSTGKTELQISTSLPISLERVGQGPDDLAKYDDFLTTLTEQCMDSFSHICYHLQRNDFLGRLLQLMVQYRPQNKDEADFIRSVNKMMVVCYVLGRTAQIPSDEHYKLSDTIFFKKWRPGRCNFNSVPRMANRQLKYIFLRILNRTMDAVLRRLDRVYRSSKGCREWLMAFYGVIGLAMTFEDLQNTVHGFLRADVSAKISTEQEVERKLRDATSEIDKRFSFMAKLFRLKYHRQFNPLTNYDSPDVQTSLGEEAVSFVSQVADLVSEKYDECLVDHQRCAVNYNDDMNLYYGRLVAQFLCSFFGPSSQ